MCGILFPGVTINKAAPFERVPLNSFIGFNGFFHMEMSLVRLLLFLSLFITRLLSRAWDSQKNKGGENKNFSSL